MRLPSNWIKATKALREAGYDVRERMTDRDEQMMLERYRRLPVSEQRRTKLLWYTRRARTRANHRQCLDLWYSGTNPSRMIGLMNEAGVMAAVAGSHNQYVRVSLRS